MKEFLMIALDVLGEDYEYMLNQTLGTDFKYLHQHYYSERAMENMGVNIIPWMTYQEAFIAIKDVWKIYLPQKRTVLTEKTIKFNKNPYFY